MDRSSIMTCDICQRMLVYDNCQFTFTCITYINEYCHFSKCDILYIGSYVGDGQTIGHAITKISRIHKLPLLTILGTVNTAAKRLRMRQVEHFWSLFQSHFPLRSKSASFCVQLAVQLFSGAPNENIVQNYLNIA